MEFTVDANNKTLGWNDVCFQIPNIAELNDDDDDQNRKRRGVRGSSKVLSDLAVSLHRMKRTGRPFNPSVDVAPFIFCAIVESLPIGCMLQNLLELWNFDEDTIKHLTKEDILNALNTTQHSLTTGHEAHFDRLLGGITRNETGHIVAATGLLTNWMVYVNFSNVNHDKVGNSAGTEDWVSEEALVWENEFISRVDEIKDEFDASKYFDDDTKIYFSAGRRCVDTLISYCVRHSSTAVMQINIPILLFLYISYGDISSATMFQDMNKVVMGGALMFVFMVLVLSKFGWIELRVSIFKRINQIKMIVM